MRQYLADYLLDCQLTPSPAIDKSTCGSFDCTLLPPTQKFAFTQVSPVNEKWDNPPESNEDSPEYLIDTSTVYFFDFTEQDLLTGKQFSAAIPV